LPKQLLAVTLVDLRANLERMRRIVLVLNGSVRDFERETTTPTALSEIRIDLDQLRELNQLNTELLFAADAGLTALVAGVADAEV
jgi:hypothetical protein